MYYRKDLKKIYLVNEIKNHRILYEKRSLKDIIYNLLGRYIKLIISPILSRNFSMS